MDELATAQSENENLRKIRNRLMQWEGKQSPLAELTVQQEECLDIITSAWNQENENAILNPETLAVTSNTGVDVAAGATSKSFQDLLKLHAPGIDTTTDFLLWYDKVHAEIHEHADAASHRYLHQLQTRSIECQRILEQISLAMERLSTLSGEYEFVSNKTSALNTASEQLIEEQEKLQQLSEEIQRRLHYFGQVELLQQRLQSPTLSVASEAFRECLNKIDECLEYMQANPKCKDAASFGVKYKHCLAKAVTLIKNYCSSVMSQATEATLRPKQAINSNENCSGLMPSTSPDAAFALYYGKYQLSAAKIKRVTQMIEDRPTRSAEYEHLLSEIQQNYLTERASIMSPAVDKAIKDLRNTHKGDHCSLTRSACAFLVHVCQDEHRLYFQFFALDSELLIAYLEGLCTILYDAMRPYIIHINHLETLAEICSILRIEMIEEHVQQNPQALEAFAATANQLLQDVQERLVFRAYLYLQSDILNYNPSKGDLAYPDKLEMMESIALSLQEPPALLRRSDSRSSLISTVSSVMDAESVDTAYRPRNLNSPADLHGMWYPTVRRTLVCLSRLYRCIDRPIFQGLSQEALKLCIQSVSAAATKISSSKTPIDGELFEIKHLLILREQIAPFRVDFTVKETSLDFSKVKTAAFGLLQKRKQLFSMGSNNALLEFLLDGTPQIKEHLLDSRKEVDRQLKTVCEQFIRDAVQMLVGPLAAFLDKAQALLTSENSKAAVDIKERAPPKLNYVLRQSAWASPQQISSIIQESQRLIKAKLAALQRSMQLYLSNRDTEFIIFRPIRNNIIQTFVKLEQLLSTNGYTSDDMIICGCPSGEQVSILLSSASIVAVEAGVANFSAAARKLSNDSSIEAAATSQPTNAAATNTRKVSLEKRVSFEEHSAVNIMPQQKSMSNVPELSESVESATASPVAKVSTKEIDENKNVESTLHQVVSKPNDVNQNESAAKDAAAEATNIQLV